MSLNIDVKITGDARVMRKLAVLGKSVNSMPDAMKEIGKELAEYYRTTGMVDKGRPYGKAWPSLSLRYQRFKQKKWAAKPMLVASGHMANSFFATANNTEVRISNSASYYKYHQSSAPRSSKLPRRQMAGVNGKLKDVIRDIVRKELIKKMDSVR